MCSPRHKTRLSVKHCAWSNAQNIPEILLYSINVNMDETTCIRVDDINACTQPASGIASQVTLEWRLAVSPSLATRHVGPSSHHVQITPSSALPPATDVATYFKLYNANSQHIILTHLKQSQMHNTMTITLGWVALISWKAGKS